MLKIIGSAPNHLNHYIKQLCQCQPFFVNKALFSNILCVFVAFAIDKTQYNAKMLI